MTTLNWNGPLQTWVVAVLGSIVLASTAGPTAAQTLWEPPYETNQVSVEWIAPTLRNEAVRLPGGAAYLNASYAVARPLEVIVELPFAYQSGASGTASTVGNPYVGLGVSAASAPLLLEVGARVPMARDTPALLPGKHANVGRTNSFRVDERSLSALLSWRYLVRRNLSVRVRGGVVGAQYPAGSPNAGREARLRYGLQAWYEEGPALAGLTVTGAVTEPFALSLSPLRKRSRTHVMGTVIWDRPTLKPGLLIGVPTSWTPANAAPVLVGLTLTTSAQ